MQTNHIAVLVRDLEAVSSSLPESCTRHALEEQPAEGTLEQYVTFGEENAPALLLIQAIADGPYSRALEKRGPGLHHIGCVCSDLEKELTEGDAGRFLLHPISLRTHKNGVVWLCRPGVPYLVELMENPEQDAIPHKKAAIRMPAGTRIPPFARAVSSNLTIRTGDKAAFRMNVNGINLCIDLGDGNPQRR